MKGKSGKRKKIYVITPETMKKIKLKKKEEVSKIKKMCLEKKKFIKQPISNDIINLFYESPNEFFASFEQSLEKTSFFDEGGNSIFAHYFYVLHDLFKNKSNVNENIYENNFNLFFGKECKYLFVQDFQKETPLHKLVKFNNKTFFFYICKKLKSINALNEELLLINNINEKSCFIYIWEEIKRNKIKIIQNDFQLYQEFFNYFPNLIKSLPLEERKFLVLFSCLIIFDEQNWNKVNFNDVIKSLYDLKEKNSDILNTFQILYYPNESNLNYLNCLYHICKDISDFDKLFKLISDISNIKSNSDLFEKLCLADHISYVLGKMNSKKYRGDMEMNYGKKLMNKIIPLLIANEKNKNVIINIISVRKGIKRNINMNFNNNKNIFNSLINNPNLLFEQKYEMINTIIQKFGNYFDDIIDKDFLCLYKIFEAYKKQEITETNITSIFKQNDFIHKIFSDFFYIGKLYRDVYQTWKEFGQISINEYITSLNQFINNNYLDIFSKYKIIYKLSEDKIKIISKLIIAYEKQNYSNENEKEYILKIIPSCFYRHDIYTELLYRQFMQSKPNLMKILLYRVDEKDIRKTKDFLLTFYSFKYDYEIIFNDEKFHKILEENNQIFINKKYLFMFKNSLKSAKNKAYEYSYYNLILKHFPLQKIFKTEISEFYLLLNKYLNKLYYHWESECDFSDLNKFINDNIIIFCFLLLKKDEKIEQCKNRIKFFFEEFINLIEPNAKERIDIIKKLAYEYLDYESIDKFYFDLSPKYYLSLWLIFIRLKFGKHNPQLLILFISYYGNIDFIFNKFISSYLETDNKQDILYHYFLIENELIFEKDYKMNLPTIKYCLNNKDKNNILNHANLIKYLTKFFSTYLYKVNKIGNSFLFYYIERILEKTIEECIQKEKEEKEKELEEEEGKKEEKEEEEKEKDDSKQEDKNISEFDIKDTCNIKIELYKYFIFEIDKNQNERIYNLTKTLLSYLKNNNMSLFSFLEIEPFEFNGGRIVHNMKILKQLSIDLEYNNKNINEEDIYLLVKENVNDNTLLNLYRILHCLKKEGKCLLNYVNSNKLFILNTFYVLLKNFYFCITKRKEIEKTDKSKLNSIDEQYDIIFEEIVNFVNFYKNNENNFYENNDQFCISKCLLYILGDSNYKMLYKKLIINMNKIRNQIFYNPKAINFQEILELLNKDIFILNSFIFQMFYKDINEEKEEEKANDEVINIFYFIFEHFIFSINPDLKNKYQVFKYLYTDLISIESKMNETNKSFILDEFINDGKHSRVNYSYICFVLIYIYIKKTYHFSNPYILLYIYNTNEEKFFIKLNKCLSDSINKNSLEKHLFIEKEDKNYIKFIEKNRTKFNEKFILRQINVFMDKYLIDLNYSENSFIYNYISEIIKNENISKNNDCLNEIIFNYFPPEEKDKNQEKNILLYNNILKIFSSNFTFYGFLNENYELNMDDKNRMTKKIKIIAKLIAYSLNNEIKLIEAEYCQDFLKRENFMNLFLFLSTLKSQNIRLYNFSKNNLHFIEETIKVFINIYNLLKNNLVVDYIRDKDIQEKNEVVINEIKEFFDDLFHDESNRENLHQYEIKNYKGLYNILIEFALYYKNSFYEQISNIKGKSGLSYQFKNFKNVISFMFSQIKRISEMIQGKNKSSNKGSIERKMKINNFSLTLNKLFQLDVDIFCELLEIVLRNFNTSTKEDITKIIISSMKLDVEKFFKNFKNIKTIITNTKLFEIEKELDILPVISFILNNSDYKIYSKINLIANSSIYKNDSKAFILMNNINNKEASLFLYKKIETLFKSKNNKERFIEFINYNINNNFVFDHLISFLSENDFEDIIRNNNQYQKNIISSLFRYSMINAYYIIKKLLSQLSKYLSKDEFQSIVYSQINEPIVSPSEYNLKDLVMKDEKLYLLSHSLSIKVVNNYETIAVILGFCQYPDGIKKLMEFLRIGLNLDFSNFICFNFFSNIKNKEKIKELEENFYNLIILSEAIINNNKILINFSDIEKFIFNNIIKIFIFDITPRELMLLTDVDIPEGRVKNINRDEIKLFILLTLFEIKGMSIVPIKKYFPKFYSKIEEFFYKSKNLIKINQICLKQPSDVKLYEKLKLFLPENNCNFIAENFPLYNNLLTIFILEKKNKDFTLDLHKEKMISINKLIIDLISDNNITPFYDNNSNKEFFESIFSINEKQKVDMNYYKYLIDSLSDFHQSCHIIIQNNDQKKNEYKWKNKKFELNVFMSYLEAISNICRYVIFACDENKNKYNVNYYLEELSNENEKRINDLKNSINLNKIILYIIHYLDNSFNDNNNNNNEFKNCLKNWMNNYLKNDAILNNLSKERIKDIVSYFKYLNLSCFILLKFINQINIINGISNCINDINNKKPNNITIDIRFNKIKESAEKGTKESLYKLGNEILREIKEKKGLGYSIKDTDYNIADNITSNISIYFDFNEKEEKFVETFTDMDLINFINNKTNSIFEFLKIKDINDIIFLGDNITEKKMDTILEGLCLTIDNKSDKKTIDGTLQILNSFLAKNKDYICKYLENTAFNINQPNYNDCANKMMEKIMNVLYNYIYPCIVFNNLLFHFCDNNFFHNYVDFTELISSIKQTKFIDDDLNSAFQIQAINYLIYSDSNLNLFLFELFDKICKKFKKKKKYEIKECFKIKVEEGGKKNFELIKRKKSNLNDSNLSDISSIISNNSIKGKKLKLKKIPDFINSKKKMFFSIVSLNPKKRQKIPTINCSTHISGNFVGSTMGNIYKEVFKRSIFISTKKDFLDEKCNNIITKKEMKRKHVKYISIFEYIFTIQSVDNEKIIHICKNDISEILRTFSKKEDFISLLNNKCLIEKNWYLKFDLDDIKISYKFA